jgi:hypothetical protein
LRNHLLKYHIRLKENKRYLVQLNVKEMAQDKFNMPLKYLAWGNKNLTHYLSSRRGIEGCGCER